MLREASVPKDVVDKAMGRVSGLERPNWRSGFKKKVEDKMPKTKDGNPQIRDLDETTKKPVLRERLPGEKGEIGHIPGKEHHKLVKELEAKGKTQHDLNNLVHEHPEWFRIETKKLNGSHLGEAP